MDVRSVGMGRLRTDAIRFPPHIRAFGIGENVSGNRNRAWVGMGTDECGARSA